MRALGPVVAVLAGALVGERTSAARSPVPHLIEARELGTDLSRLGQRWGDRPERAVADSLGSIRAGASRRGR